MTKVQPELDKENSLKPSKKIPFSRIKLLKCPRSMDAKILDESVADDFRQYDTFLKKYKTISYINISMNGNCMRRRYAYHNAYHKKFIFS